MAVTRIVFIGGGGHAMSCLDACDSRSLEVVGYIAPQADERFPLPWLGTDAALEAVLASGVTSAFVAIGDNARRRDLTEHVVGSGFRLATVLASTARISPHAVLDPGAAVLHGAMVGPRTRVGGGAVLNTSCSVDHDCTIGAFAHLAPGTHLAGGVDVGTGVFAGVGVSVVPDVEIGEWTVIGAGAAVVRDLPPKTTAVGVPAKPRSAT